MDRLKSRSADHKLRRKWDKLTLDRRRLGCGRRPCSGTHATAWFGCHLEVGMSEMIATVRGAAVGVGAGALVGRAKNRGPAWGQNGGPANAAGYDSTDARGTQG